MKRKLEILGNIVICIFLVFAVFATVIVFSAIGSEDGYPKLFGKLLIPVNTEKAAADIQQGDLLITDAEEGFTANDIKADDVIVFTSGSPSEGKGSVFIDTVKEILKEEDGSLTYKFNRVEPVTAVISKNGGLRGIRIIAVYDGVKVSGFGYALSFLITPTGYIAVVIIPLVLFFLFELFNYFVTVLGVSMRPRGISAEEEEEIKRRAVEEYIENQQRINAARNDGFKENGNGA